jgi:hypothetical protein
MEIRELAKLKEYDLFKDLFTVDKLVFEKIWMDMKKHGFDRSKPIDIWKAKQVVVDGYTRMKAAKKAGLKEVMVCEHIFANEDEALEYAIHNQSARRNLSDAELLRCVQAIDKRKKPGPKTPQSNNSKGLQNNCATSEAQLLRKPPKGLSSGIQQPKERSSKETADLLKSSRGKVEKARTVMNKGSEEIIKAVDKGEMSINKAYNKVTGKDEKKPTKKEGGTWTQWVCKNKSSKKVPSSDQLVARLKVAIDEGVVGSVILIVKSKDEELPEFDSTWDWVEDLISYGKDSGCIVYHKSSKENENE